MRVFFCLALMLTTFVGPSAYATSCGFPSFKETLARHDLIFKGKAVSSGDTTLQMKAEYEKNRNPDIKQDRGLPNSYTDFEVQALYKGVAGKTVRVFYQTRDVSKGGGFMIAGDFSVEHYKNGTEAVVYAKRAGSLYLTYRGLCSYDSMNRDGGEVFEEILVQYRAMDELIAKYPNVPEFYIKKIALFEKNTDFDGAVATYDRLFAAIPGSKDKPELRADYGRLLQLAGRYDESLKALEGAKGQKGTDTAQQLSMLRLGRATELSGQKLALAGQELGAVTIKDADLSGADFKGAKLSAVTFENVKLTGADFSGAQMQANFTNCDLTGSQFGGVNMRGGLEGNTFDKALFKGAKLDLGGVRNNKFTGADFTDAKLHIMEGRLRGKDDKGNTGNNFSGASFKNANVGGIGGSVITGADFTGASFYSGRTTSSQNQGLDLSGQKLDGSKLGSGDFTGGSFKNASLKGASFSGSKLEGISFAGADLSGADFTVSRYSGQTKLHGADFTSAKIEGAKWDGAVFDCKTKFPPNFDTLAERLEPADPACAKKPPLGMYEYTKERLMAGRLKPCNGDYHAACIYGLIINHALVMGTGGYSAGRIHNFQDIAQSLEVAGEQRLTKILLMRAYVENQQIFYDRELDAQFATQLRRTGLLAPNKYSTSVLPEAEIGSWRMNGRGGKSKRDEALALLKSGDKEKTRAFLLTAIAESDKYVDVGPKINVLLNYADIFIKLEGGLEPALVAELEKRIRTIPYNHFEGRDRDKPQPVDYVAEGERLLEEVSTKKVSSP